MRRLSSRYQLWISMATASLCIAITFIILHTVPTPSSDVIPVTGASLPTNQDIGRQVSVDQLHREQLVLTGLNCLRQKEGLPLFEAFDPELSRTAEQLLKRLYYEDKVLEELDGYTIRALLALDFSKESGDCVVAGLELNFLAPVSDTKKIGIAFSQTASYRVNSAVLIGR